MLVFGTNSGGIPVVPACLDGWLPRGDYSLCHRDLADGLHAVGPGLSYAFEPPKRWAPLDDGWRVGLSPGVTFDPAALVRGQLWCDTVPVQDLTTRVWVAPVIRTFEGKRAFRVAYGRNWLPDLTADQIRAEAIADEVLQALASGECPIAVACQWAAELLSMTNHVTPEVIAALGLLDDRLVFATLAAAVSRSMGRAEAE